MNRRLLTWFHRISEGQLFFPGLNWARNEDSVGLFLFIKKNQLKGRLCNRKFGIWVQYRKWS